MQNLVCRKISRNHRIYGTFAIAFIAIGMLVGCNMSNDRSQSPKNLQLTGTWEFKNQDGSKNGNAIFVDQNGIEGDVYIVSNDGKLGKIAIAGKFKTNSSTNPPQLDLIFGDLTTQTIYEISNDGLKIANTFPEQLRPKSWDAQPQQLTKISDSTNIATDIKILRSPDLIASSSLIREAESKSNIRAILRSQQQIFLTKEQFSQNINQLSTGLSLNSEFYKYQITILENGLLAQHSAIPLKNGLKAYTGISYAIAVNNSNLKTIKLLMCESNLPTQEIPFRPQNNLPSNSPNNSQDQEEIYLCPNGYTSIKP